MIGGCLISTSYVFKADIFKKVRTVKYSGQIDYKWQFEKTINCLVSPYISRSFRLQGITETFGSEYKDFTYLKMQAAEHIGQDRQVSNIKDKTGKVIYSEVELNGAPGTWFNINGVTPIIDPFGSVVQFNHLLARAESQGAITSV